MPWIRFAVIVCCLSGLNGATMVAPPGEWKLPPLNGELSGDFVPALLPDAPPVHWKLVFRAARPRVRSVEFAIDGPGLELRGSAELDPMGEGEWRLTGGKMALAQWMPFLLPVLSPDSVGMVLAGDLEATGSGTWRAGVLGGQATVSVRDGRVEDPAHKLTLEGVTLDLELADLASRRAGPGQILTWRKGSYDVIALGTARIEFALEHDELRVNDSNIDVFGGELRVNSFVMSTRRREFSVAATMTGVAVEQILFLIPPVLAEAHGKLDGKLTLHWDSNGVQIGAGRLALREGDTAELRLSPAATSLSGNLPASVQKLYPGLVHMETGGVPLRAQLLDLILTPDGDSEGRTASVHIIGGPEDPSLRAPIDLTVNVRGPLESLVRFGTNSRLRFGGGR